MASKIDSPMVPFFADVFGGIVRDFLKLLKLRKATNLYQLVQIDPPDKNRKSAADVDIGFAANIKAEESNLNPNVIPKFLLLKKRLETSLLHYCHIFLKGRHWNMHLFETLHL